MVYESAAGRIYGLKGGSCRIWQLTDLPPGSNMLRLAYADSGSACKLAGVQIIPLPTLANQILARTFFSSVALQLACPAAGKFSRASSAGDRRNLQTNFVQPDCVGRRGLSEPREDFSRLITYAFRGSNSVSVSAAQIQLNDAPNSKFTPRRSSLTHSTAFLKILNPSGSCFRIADA